MNVKASARDMIAEAVRYCFLALCALCVLYPLVYILSCSFSAPSAVVTGKVWLWPVDVSLSGYKAVFAYPRIWQGYLNTVIYAVAGTAISVALTILASYPLSRPRFIGKSFFMFFFAFTMIFNGGIIPMYLLVKDVGLLNSGWAMILPNALSVWNIIITRTYYQSTIAPELLEAAQIDGCSDFRFLGQIALPLSGAITAVNVLFYAVGIWNSFFDALIYLSAQAKYPLQLVLRQILMMNDVSNSMTVNISSESQRLLLRETLKYSLIVVASVPVLCIYPFVQKYFVKGVMIGSLKA